MNKPLSAILLLLALCFGIYALTQRRSMEGANIDNTTEAPPQLGDITHTYNGVEIYSNGEHVYESHGKHYADDGYYYGHKWQCVEFIKRYYHDAHGHQMPNVWGHAKDFFNTSIPTGQINPDRGMTQFHNGSTTKPAAHDLLVWNHNKYGHVAIIVEVSDKEVKIVQQNIAGHPTQSLPLKRDSSGCWTINPGSTQPAGFLRLTQS